MSTARIKPQHAAAEKPKHAQNLWHEQWSALATSDDGMASDDAAVGIEAALPFLWHGSDAAEGLRA